MDVPETYNVRYIRGSDLQVWLFSYEFSQVMYLVYVLLHQVTVLVPSGRARLKQNHEKKTRSDISTKKVKRKTGKTAPPTKRGRGTRSQEYEGGRGGSYGSYMKNTPTRERSWKTAPLRIDSYQKGRLFLPKGARIPTKNPEHTNHTSTDHQHERHQTHKPKQVE
jgi:hypothetical protein